MCPVLISYNCGTGDGLTEYLLFSSINYSDSLSSRATTFLIKAVETGPRRSKKLEAGGYCLPGSLAFHFLRFKYLKETGMHNNGHKYCEHFSRLAIGRFLSSILSADSQAQDE